MKSQKLPITSDTPENGIPAGWKRELSEWLLVVTTMGITIWVLVTLVRLVLDIAIGLRQLIN